HVHSHLANKEFCSALLCFAFETRRDETRRDESSALLCSALFCSVLFCSVLFCSAQLYSILILILILAAKVEWKNKENLNTGFKFLFALFRKYYLPHLFPSFIKLTNLYNPVLGFPGLHPKSVYVSTTCDGGNVYRTKIPYLDARVTFIKWLVKFFLEKKYLTAAQTSKNGVEVLPRIIQVSSIDKISVFPEKNHINYSGILNDSSFCSIEEQHRSAYEMVEQIFLSTRDYVNFVNEVFHQAFLLPPSEISLTEKIVKVYRKWILHEKPVFMQEPDAKETIQDDDVITEHSTEETNEYIVQIIQNNLNRFIYILSLPSFPPLSLSLFLLSFLQNIKVFLTNSANIFLLEPCSEAAELLKEQINSCRAVLSIYRRMIMEVPMNKKTWYHMLQMLLSITEAVMKISSFEFHSVEDENPISSPFFLLWDELLRVLSSLTDWEELIIEWSNIMDSLTSVLARTVYGVEMTNLPLDKLSEQKEKIQKGRGGVLDSQKGAAVGRSFSLSWRDHPDVAEPMRFRSATTSGVPGIEKARNIVRQRTTAKRSLSINNCARLCEALPATKSVPLLLHTVSSLLPDISYTSYSCTFSGMILYSCYNLTRLYSALFYYSSEFLADDCSIIAGGTLTGWHPDSAAVLWRRTLGILGDVNNIQSPKIHARVVEYLFELWHKLAKIRDNLAVSLDNQSTPSPPVLIPPLRIFASWLFKATTLPDEYKEGKIHAYKLICAMMTRRQDFMPNPDYLVHFYLIMHIGLNNKDQNVLNTIIKHCSPFFFFLGLPGFTLLIRDFITAATRVLSTNMLEAPRIEANTILGSLICFPNLYQNISLLSSVTEAEITTGTADVKCCLINILLKNATEEPSEASRYLALCCLGIWICEELVHCTNHPQVKDAINVCGVTLKVQVLVATIAFLLPSAEYSSVESDKKFIVSLLLCLLDWCMTLPVKTLLKPVFTSSFENQYSSNTPLLDYIYRILNCCVHGSSLYAQQSHYLLSLADLSSDSYDPFMPVGNLRNSKVILVQSLELIPLTARMIMAHLVNNLGHYPLTEGPAVLHSLISENHNNSCMEFSELSPEVFRSPNLQIFEFNDNAVISYLQIPSKRGMDDELEESFSEVRVIVRDISGKYSWDGQLMNGPLAACSVDQMNRKLSVVMEKNKQNFESPTDFIQIDDGEDALDRLLEKIGSSSPECLLHPQVKLNEPSPSIMNHAQANDIIEAIMQQSFIEKEYAHGYPLNHNTKSKNQKMPRSAVPQSPFHLCRLFLNGLGMNSWEKRKSFNILKKNSKLLRELKNLDSRQCRETHKIAVVYIAEGQEDKCSILSNPQGSQAYEDFIAGLGWEVDLSTHCGFMGGLQRNGSTGQTAPYYATSSVEVIFHVSTRMSSDSNDSLTKKLRHLGNDEVHVIWSEHTRNYRRGIIPTDFGDVLIIIYPMRNHMFYIEILKKPQVPFFGPLFNGAIVTAKLLPNLIRATCINASRAVKSLITLYQSFYEERAIYLDEIIRNHKEQLSFEDFAAQVFSPSPSYSRNGCGKSLYCIY
uniref:Ral GTPase activating protein catalytic subunit alpha 2 n=1 Tax=Laticauda laticaudata TaxID=8630 RepID=A0A8C5SYT4_LATLA